MKIFSFLFIIFLVVSIVASVTTYAMYGIYDSKKMLYIMPVFGFLPFITLIIGRIYGGGSIEKYLGHFLFYYNYISILCLTIVFIQILSHLMKRNFFKYLNENQLRFSVMMLIVIGLIAIYGRYKFETVKGITYKIKIDKKNNGKKMKIGFISDIHLNNIFDGEKLNFALEKMKNDGAEVILIGGDFVDNNSSLIGSGIKEIIEKYNFKHGIYTVLGNHEYYGGIEKNIEYIKSIGINILRDKTLEIDGITVLGRDDKTNKERKNLKKLLEERDNKNPIIVIDHNPITLSESIENEIDLHLSGHTHNGQLFPMNYLTDYLNLNGNGYKKFKDTHSFVSSGLGTWMIPYRVGSQSQYVVLELQFD